MARAVIAGAAFGGAIDNALAGRLWPGRGDNGAAFGGAIDNALAGRLWPGRGDNPSF